MRVGRVKRKTLETDILVEVNLDGTGISDIKTPIMFLNHMLTSLATHSLIDVKVKAEGDLKHHIVEDTAICLGTALREALDNSKIHRFGNANAPMDCSLASAAVDIGNRSYWVIDIGTEGSTIEDISSEDITHFLCSLASSLKANIHIKVEYGENDHHKAESAFKALALSLRQAFQVDPRRVEVPSSKGVL